MTTTTFARTTSPLDNAASVRVPLEQLAIATDTLRRHLGTSVVLTAEFVDANSYAMMSASDIWTVTVDGGDYLALTAQLTEMGTSSSDSAGYALSERCTLIVPTPVHQSGGMCHLLAGEYGD